MSHIIPFPKPDPSSQSVEDFVIWLQLLDAHAKLARRKIARARSLDKVIAYYAEWLRRYWEMNRAVRLIWNHLEQEIRVHGREIDVDRADDVVAFMVAIEAAVKGSSPWLSLPNFERTKCAASDILNTIVDSINRAIGKANAIGRPTFSPDERNSA